MALSNITVHTGLPGAGKTLFTIYLIKQLADQEKAPVYFSGIPDCMVPGWIELEDASKWHELPPRSILIIDEAQRVFRPRHVGSQVPEHVAKLETIRHQGIRLVLITQHPRLIESNVRRLAGKHRHYIRAFGSKVVSVHEWDEVKEDCDSSGGRRDSLRSSQAHPVEVYKWYKSAEVHTVKRSVPKRLLLALCIPLLVAGLGWVAFKSMAKLGDSDRITAAAGIKKGAEAAKSALPGNPSAKDKAALTDVEWVELRRPRIAGLAFTAPAYDEVTKPTAAPFPAACASMGSRCRCYTEQATVLEMDDELCRSIVERGFFKEFGPENSALSERGASRPPLAAPATPAQAPTGHRITDYSATNSS